MLMEWRALLVTLIQFSGSTHCYHHRFLPSTVSVICTENRYLNCVKSLLIELILIACRYNSITVGCSIAGLGGLMLGFVMHF